jgi:hypothetical protein
MLYPNSPNIAQCGIPLIVQFPNLSQTPFAQTMATIKYI